MRNLSMFLVLISLVFATSVSVPTFVGGCDYATQDTNPCQG